MPWLWLVIFATSAQSQQPAEKADRAPIEQWVRDLDSNLYESRKRAMERLIRLGGDDVVENVEKALREGASVELQIRAFRILSKLAIECVATEESSAYEALRAIGETVQNSTGRRAQVALRDVNQVYRTRASEELKKLGAELDQRQVLNQFAGGGRLELMRSYTIGSKWKGGPTKLRLLRYFDDLQVRLDGEEITDEYVAPLAAIQSLKRVNITSTKVTDKGLALLKDAPQLEEVRVFFTPITDKSADAFMNMPRLNKLYLIGTDMTSSTVNKMRRELAGVRIDFRSGGFLGVGSKLGANRCMINQPQPGSAAERAGLRDGDIIVKYNGVDVKDFEALRDLISLNAAKEEIEIVVQRGAQRLTKTAKLGAWSYEAML